MMTTRFYKTLFVIFLSLVSAIATFGVYASGYWAKQYGIEKGSAVVLHQPLTISTGTHQAFIQGGEVTPNKVFPFTGGFDQYYPFCYFELRKTAEQSTTIQPDRFTITRVRLEETDFVGLKPVIVANSGDEGGLEVIAQILILELSSQSQPEVELMVCAEGFDVAGQEEFPKLRHIMNTLGQVASLEI